ncbi:MAG TPA: ATP-binding protein, partial [Myxococcales bacterium]|nr:ATP-binding protein [Myxococcales bacterium]
SDFLRERHEEIIARWEAQVRRLRPAKFLNRPTLLDHIPDFLRELADFVSQAREDHDAAPPQGFPVVHAVERLDVGYDLTEVVGEYRILRQCITALAQSDGTPALFSAELPRLHDAIDLAISASVARYHQVRERTLKALDRISTAALGERSIEQFLPRTLSALLETTPSIDGASILLLEDDRLVVRASAGLAAAPGASCSLKLGECFAGAVWKAGEPILSRDAEHDPRVTTDTIRKQGTRAMYGVPLHFGDQMVGVALMGSTSTYAFSHEDLLLFRTAANRVAALVAQARLDEEVRRQQALYESIVSALGDIGEGFCIIDGAQIAVANDTLCRIVGLSREEMHALPSAFELVVPGEREKMAELIRSRFAGEGRDSTGRLQTAFRHKDGRRIDVELGVKRKATGRVVVVVRDVTEQMQVERERSEQRARLETVLRVLPVGLALGEAPSGRLVLANAELDRIWGRKAAAESIEDYRQFEGWWPDGRKVEPQEWPMARALRGEMVPLTEVHIVGSDGVRRITEHAASPVRDASGAIVAAVVTAVDLTERKQTEEELRQALAFRDQILNVLAHDLRQPLSVIGMSARLLLHREGLEAHTAAFSRQIRNVERMERLIRDLLDYARARRGTALPVDRKPLDLALLVQHAVEGIETLHPDRSIRLDVQGDCTGRFDADRMQQVFGNLLGNAVAYSPRGTPIDVTLSCSPTEVICAVHNQGQPIPADRLQTIFEPFRRGDTGANPAGLGLGLFIVRQLVRAHGGRVEVTSSANDGTTFRVVLPR